MAPIHRQPVHGHPVALYDTPEVDFSAIPINPTISEASFRARNDEGNLARSRAQSWAFEPVDDDVQDVTNKPIPNPLRLAPVVLDDDVEDVTNVPIANPLRLPAAAPDYGSYCERCGTPKAAGVPTEEATNAKKEWVIEARVKAKNNGSWVKRGESKKNAVEERQGKAIQGGGAGGLVDEGVEQVKEDGDTKLGIKKGVAPIGRVCDRCGAEDGKDGKFWPFHVLDSGSNERVRRDS